MHTKVARFCKIIRESVELSEEEMLGVEASEVNNEAGENRHYGTSKN